MLTELQVKKLMRYCILEAAGNVLFGPYGA